MPKKPEIPHELIVEYILAGHTTAEAREYFKFKNENIANIRIHTAFKALKIPRPRYQEAKECQFCKLQYIARDKKQRTCGNETCQRALILEWQAQNRHKTKLAHQKYRQTEKGRQNNLRMHATRRAKGREGSLCDKWNYALGEATKPLRKSKNRSTRHQWEYRLEHIQQMCQIQREFLSRRERDLDHLSGQLTRSWLKALRAIQTTSLQGYYMSESTIWEKTINKIANSLRTGVKIRQWKKQKK